MPYKEKLIEKKYYTIGEVASMFGVAASLIRFWEQEFEILKPKKNSKGNRQFIKTDIDNLRMIYSLVKEKGYTLQGAKDILKNKQEIIRDKLDVIERLKKVKKFLIEIKDQLP